MTQLNDPWAAAASGQSTREHTSATQDGQPDTSSSLAGEAYSEPQSSLFGATIETLPSLFTLQHAPGTTIRLTITAKPKDVQSTCHPSKSPDGKSRLREYWNDDPATGARKPGLVAADPRTGKPNDPVMNLVLSGDTAERDTAIEGDDGRRSWFLNGSARAPKGHKVGDPTTSSRLALIDAIKLDGKISCDADMINRVIEVRRIERTGLSQTDKWKWQARFVA